MNDGIYLENDFSDDSIGRPVGSFPHYLGSNFNLNIVHMAWEKLHPKSGLWNGGISSVKFDDMLKESKEYYLFEEKYLKNLPKKIQKYRGNDRKEYMKNLMKEKRKNGRILSKRFSL
jgi:hypothetical protein